MAINPNFRQNGGKKAIEIIQTIKKDSVPVLIAETEFFCFF